MEITTLSKVRRIRNPGLIKEMKEKIGRCICCGEHKDLQVHHIRSVGRGGGDIPYNLLVVCFKCHRLIHDRGTHIYKTWPHVWEYMQKLGWVYLGKRLVNTNEFR